MMIYRFLATAGVALALLTVAGESSAGPAGPPEEADVAVQARGPVHEGYAQPYDPVPQPGPVVPKEPPEAVPEVPPEQKPEGDNVRWLPGYWAWDADKNDFLWVSGFWRVMPPERKWVPGYWRRADDGWQWVPGYWASEGQEQPPLLEQPPAPLATGPSIPAPDDDHVYVPGSWVWRADRYCWRPGYWRPCRPGWVWTPAHYCWTPAGWVYADGFWDRCLEDRGVLFAPVVFRRPLWQTPGWCYRPRFAVSLGTAFFSALFVRPAHFHYYFGDYYDHAYARAGCEPWWQYGPRCHDPLFGYYRWHHRHDAAWQRGLRDDYVARRDGDLPRPPRTLAEQTAVARQAAPKAPPPAPVVAPLSDVRGSNLRLVSVGAAQRAEQQAAAQRLREVSRQRAQAEKPSGKGRSAAQAPARTPPPARAAGGNVQPLPQPPRRAETPAPLVKPAAPPAVKPRPTDARPAPTTKPAQPAPAPRQPPRGPDAVTRPATRPAATPAQPPPAPPAPRQVPRGTGVTRPATPPPAPPKPAPQPPQAPRTPPRLPEVKSKPAPPPPAPAPRQPAKGPETITRPARAPTPPPPAKATPAPKPPAPVIVNQPPRAAPPAPRAAPPPVPRAAPPPPRPASPPRPSVNPPRYSPPPAAPRSGGQRGGRDDDRRPKRYEAVSLPP